MASCPGSFGGNDVAGFGCCPGCCSGSHPGCPGYAAARHDEGWGCACEEAELGRGGARDQGVDLVGEAEVRENL